MGCVPIFYLWVSIFGCDARLIVRVRVLRSLVDALEDLCRPVVENLGYQFWGLQFAPKAKQSLVRVFIDLPEGISVDDCAVVSHQVAGVLEVENILQSGYSLEVSSPGLDRLLFKLSQYRPYCGSFITLQVSPSASGLPKKMKAKLLVVDELKEVICVEWEKKTLEIPFLQIEKARLVPEF
jgi:ribosome maturation factor RimP